ncbi:MAG: polysaccharide biosynthesis tyrosine autokinase [Mariniblastus sp.]|nr:polysaccharide biosynthesis tyrosine autokinase [Mariniblastus sp.]
MKKNLPTSKSAAHPDAIALAKLVLRKWGVVAFFAGTLLATAAAVLTIWFWEPSYDAKQFVKIRQNREFIAIDDNSNKKMEPKRYLAPVSSEPLLRELLVEEAVIERRPDITIPELKSMIRYEAVGGELYAIICRDQDPQLAAIVAELIANELLNGINDDRQQTLANLRQKIDDKILNAEADVTTLSNKMRDLNAKMMLSEPGDTTRADPTGAIRIKLENDLDVKQANLKLQQVALVRKKEELENVEDNFEEVLVLASVNSSPILSGIDTQIRQLKAERSNSLRLGSGHPSMEAINERLSRAHENREGEYAKLLETARETWVNTEKARLTREIKQIDSYIQTVTSSISSDKNEITQLVSEYRESNDLNFQIKELGWERDRAAESLSFWIDRLSNVSGKQLAEFDVTLFGTDNGSTAVQIPLQPVEQYPFKLLLIACTPAFFLPLALAFLWELKMQRVSHPDQMKGHIPSSLLGEIADLPMRSQTQARMNSKRITRQLRLYEESVDNLSAIMMHIAESQPMVFSVTSASSNEGKTTLSSQLAISSARSNFGRTLLVDADLRSPSLHRLLELPVSPGLTDILSGSATLEEAISETQIDNLDVLPAGKLLTSPRRYFSGDPWHETLALLKDRYDHIVIDTPPVLAASESLAISKECDHALMCILRDVSVTDSVKRAYDRLIAADVNVVGYAFSGVPQTEYAIKYGSYEYNMS